MNIIVTPNDYVHHSYNNTITNERCVELPLAFRFLDLFNDKTNLYEIGAVTPYYKDPSHIIIDPMDPKATKKDISQNIDYKGLNVLSISTIEHMGNGDYNFPIDKQLAINELNRIYNDSLNCFITWPIGCNKWLDKHLEENGSLYNHFLYLKTNNSPTWIKTDNKDCFKLNYYEQRCVVCVLKLATV